MMTREELITECKIQNPKMIQTINGEQFELIGEAYEEVCANWADMRLQQIAFEQDKAETKARRQALLDRLGITEEEARLLLL